MAAEAPRGLHTVGRLLTERARLGPDRVAIECGDRLRTYRGLDEHSSALAAGLLAAGLSHGDRVATLSENRVEQVELFFACAKAGLLLAPLNWRLAPPELAAQLDDLEPALLVHSPSCTRLAGRALEAAAVLPRTEEITELAGTLDNELAAIGGPAGAAVAPEQPVEDDDGLLVVFTSGTTGRSKGAVISHANCWFTNLSLDMTAQMRDDDVVLQVLPQCHVGGWNVQPLLAWWKGARVILVERFDAAAALDTIVTRRVTTMMGVPATYLMLAELDDFAAADLSSLRRVVVGGAAMPLPLWRTWSGRGVEVLQGYGLSEASPNVLCFPPGVVAGHEGSVGLPYAFVEVQLRDPDSGAIVVGPGSGEILVRGPSVFRGYWRREADTAEVLAGGWLHTGDLASRDADGFYTISGRLKEMFISGGENVYPLEVEAAIADHPGVREVAVVGVPHQRWGETGLAYVVARAAAPLTTEELAAHCRERLAGYKVPKWFVLVDELPRTSTGKLDRARLAAFDPAPPAAAPGPPTEEER